ncbi:hypothetical protein HLH34_09365 [Gluconacetobacter azotocaptans]|uniref:Uncharacterized protein n=1 Tax=Gluconacetobacter azotocaptans TaxID=142834 RepID=A0A7W4JSR0_9PROT|nr:chaperone modulator CbpM [Gluconacetobacter azotocaptans]MBB2190177.1 hypothetical protein [Gluconacetobacter azotocaptans]MBM9403034.1 hypothetical protein [Gluconacetobacter azotocaptans]GBQ28776.1 hypothetical protein AA13594_1118 [Gluconacetobacter azotocaptans DSM 13594]
MMTIDTLCVRLGNVTAADIERWIDSDWLRPEGAPGAYAFQDIDEARARLIVELRSDLGVSDEGMPLVLSLLDQLYDARRQMMRLRDALQTPQADDIRARVRGLLAELPTPRP